MEYLKQALNHSDSGLVLCSLSINKSFPADQNGLARIL